MSPNPSINPIASDAGNSRHPTPEDLTLYAMQLLAPEHTAAITRHAESCADCRAELSRIYSDLALAASTCEFESPSAESRQRLLDQVARERKFVPVAPAPVQAPPPLAAFGRSSSLFARAEKPPRHTGRIVLGIAGWAIAAGLAVAFAVEYKGMQAAHTDLATQAGEIDRLNADAAQSHQLMDALTDPRAIRATLSLSARPVPSAQPIGGVTYNPQKGALVFLASNLDPLQAAKTYELWIIPANGSAPVPAGTFHPDEQGNASLIMPDLPKGIAAKAFGVTIEPEGGSQTPTLPILLASS